MGGQLGEYYPHILQFCPKHRNRWSPDRKRRDYRLDEIWYRLRFAFRFKLVLISWQGVEFWNIFKYVLTDHHSVKFLAQGLKILCFRTHSKFRNKILTRFLSSKSIKNCEPLVLGPLFAIERTPLRSWGIAKHSSGHNLPNILNFFRDLIFNYF